MRNGNRRMRRRNQRGLTLLELVVAFSIMMVLSSLMLPLARIKMRIQREADLRYDLDMMRKAIDRYKDNCDQGYFGPPKTDGDCYPDTLEVLVEGKELANDPNGTKMKFLREIPQRPFTGKYEWGYAQHRRTTRKPRAGGASAYLTFTPRRRTRPRMVHLMRNGKAQRRRRGFTFVELMVVVTIMVILISMAIPQLTRSITRTKESVLHNNLFTLRTVHRQLLLRQGEMPAEPAGPGHRRIPARHPHRSDEQLLHRLADGDGGRHPERQPGGAGHLGRAQRLG